MKLKGYKTFLLGLLVALLPLLNYINDSQVITKVLTNPTQQQVATAVLGGLIILFRMLTTTSIFNKNVARVDTPTGAGNVSDVVAAVVAETVNSKVEEGVKDIQSKVKDNIQDALSKAIKVGK